MKNHLNMFQTSSDYEMFEKDYTQNIKPNVSLITDKDTCVFNSDYEAVIHATFNATADNKNAIYIPTCIKTLSVDGTPVKFKEPHYERIEVDILKSKINTSGMGSYPSNYVQYNDKFTITPLDSSINILDEDIRIDFLLGTQTGVMILSTHETITDIMDWAYCVYDEKNNSLTFEYLNAYAGFDNPGIIKTSAIFLRETPSGTIQYLDTKCVFNAIIGGMTSPYKFDTEGEHTVEMTLINNPSPCVFRGSCLTHITMDGVKKINKETFGYCSQLQTINFSNNLKVIGDYAFRSCPSLTSITIPDGVTSIGENAFDGCTNLASVDLGNGVTSIGDYAFRDCNNLVSLKLSKNLRTINNGAFNSCTSLKKVKIPNWVTSISGTAFSYYSDLSNIYGTHVIQNEHYIMVANQLVIFNPISNITDFTIPNNVTSISNSAFKGCGSITSITIPEGVTSIGSSAFHQCQSLTEITIPDSVTSIGDNAFFYCESLTSVTIPNGVTKIDGGTFHGCSSLTSITIPDGVTEIGETAIFNCSSLTSITIPDSVTSIGRYAFRGCESLTSVYCKATTPPYADAQYDTWDAFDDNASGRKIYVPMESVDAYKSAQYWSTYAKAIEGYNF